MESRFTESHTRTSVVSLGAFTCAAHTYDRASIVAIGSTEAGIIGNAIKGGEML